MNNHLTTFEQSKKLKEIGVPQYGEGFYCNEKDSFFSPTENVAIGYKVVAFNFKRKNHIRQFTLSELIEVLGKVGKVGFGQLKMGGEWHCDSLPQGSMGWRRELGNRPLDAAVSLILKLHQEGLLTFNEKKDETTR